MKYSVPKFSLPIIAILIVFFSCRQSQQDVVHIDFLKISGDSAYSLQADSAHPLRVAVAAIISPSESFIYYRELFDYIAQKINKPIIFEQRKTYLEINEMLADRQVDIAFICSGAYLPNKDNCDLFVVPVCNGVPYYQAYIITNVNSSINSFSEFTGKTFAYSDPLSNSGKLYPDYCVKKMFGTAPEDFFAKTIYTNAHDISIQLVSKNVVDGASVDGLIFEYLRKKTPAKMESIKIITKSEYFGIPPVVSSKWIDNDLKLKLKELFLSIHNDTAGKKILNQLMIEKFIITSDTLYNKVSEMKNFVNE